MFNTPYSYAQININRYGTAGYTGTWTVNESLYDNNIVVGQRIVLLAKNTTKEHTTRFNVKVNYVESEFRVNATTESIED